MSRGPESTTTFGRNSTSACRAAAFVLVPNLAFRRTLDVSGSSPSLTDVRDKKKRNSGEDGAALVCFCSGAVALFCSTIVSRTRLSRPFFLHPSKCVGSEEIDLEGVIVVMLPSDVGSGEIHAPPNAGWRPASICPCCRYYTRLPYGRLLLA